MDMTKLDGKPVIAILQRGWVYFGTYEHGAEYSTLNNAYNIRSFGSQRGLGQIALDGPTSFTTLDPCGRLHFHNLTTIGLMECNEKHWSKYTENNKK